MKISVVKRFFGVFLRKMTTSGQSLMVPTNVRGMKVLDREKFVRVIQVPVLKVKEVHVSKIIHCCKAFLLKVDNFKPIQDSQNESLQKILYLHPDQITCWEDITVTGRETLKQYDVSDQNYSTKEVQFGYENWTIQTIFKAVLPEGEDIVSGYSQIGHIIHLNLRDHLMDYRQLIGQVLVEKIKSCRTVVNKSNIIDNTYRNFSMEVIAGDEDYLVTVKENRCSFQFDFSKVYWNPRLGKEHERILEFLKPGDVLFDIFCGVGPFSIPAAKRKCKVFANDLNPDSFKWLNHNAEVNRVNKNMFKSFNQDGKDFILSVFKDYLIEICKGIENLNNNKIHITMNLPALAVEFLKYFKGLLAEQDLKDKFNLEIVVYVYCFAFGDNPVSVARQMVNENMECDMSPYILDVFDVRNVSPKKEMMRVTFKLAKEVLFDASNLECPEEPPLKKKCVES